MIKVRKNNDFKKRLYSPKEIKSVWSYHKHTDLLADYVNLDIVFEIIFGLPEFIELVHILDLNP